MVDRGFPESEGTVTIIKALARAFRWKRLLESGEFTTVKELAKHEGIAQSYMARVLHLTLLAPDIVEAILEGKRDYQLDLAGLLNAFPVEWQVQRQQFGIRRH